KPPSHELFLALAGMAYVYALLAGIWITADSLSEEKREGTLGLLFLTDLRGYDVVLGKLAATSMNAFYGLLAIVPILAIPLLMGGVSARLFWSVVLVLINTLFFSLSAGMLVSAVCRQDRTAVIVTFLWILFFTGGVPLLGQWLAFHVVNGANPRFITAFLLPSSAYTFGTAVSSSVSRGLPVEYWWSLVAVHLLGWLFLGLACGIVPRSWRDRTASARMARRRERWRQWCHGDASERNALRVKMLEINPVYWLSGRNRLQKALIWGTLALFGISFAWGYVRYPQDWLSAPVAVLTAIVLHVTLKLWIAVESCRRFIEDRREGALELLLCTPVTVPEILRGVRLALRRQFGGPMRAVLVLDLLLLWVGWQDLHGWEEQRDMAIAFGVWMTMLALDYYALIWVGMWLGVSARKTHLAASGTIARVLLLPWVLFAVSLSGWNSHFEAYHLMLWWFALGVSIDLIFGWRSYRKLHQQFRLAAMRQYLPTSDRRWWWPWRG
ncbi:MAG: ABC transporter permease, partial [Candidatus Omnitrophica bacterium]|nr:ABC transporter permease [Candidatus Omnitrophota bacterium]